MIHRRVKAAAEIITYQIDFSRALEEIRAPGRAYSLLDYVRPPTPTGFEYECTAAGQTGQSQPAWPDTIGETVEDGSVVWTARAFGENASNTITTITVTPETGIIVDASSFNGPIVDVTLSGGTAGEVYDVAVKVDTASGDEYEDTLRITVK